MVDDLSMGLKASLVNCQCRSTTTNKAYLGIGAICPPSFFNIIESVAIRNLWNELLTDWRIVLVPKKHDVLHGHGKYALI